MLLLEAGRVWCIFLWKLAEASMESFHRFRGNFHFYGSWKLPWVLLVEASVELHSGSFHGSFRGTGFTSIGFSELPSVIIYFRNLQAVSGSFHCSHGSFHCYHFFRGSFYGSRFRGSKWALPWKLPRQLLFGASTTSIGACFAPVEASRSFHRFRRSFHFQRNHFPV